MKFRKKPVVVLAERYIERGKFMSKTFRDAIYENEERVPFIHTLEGPLYVRDGDWIIKGINGEFYACRPDIFAATYEAVEEA